MKVLKQRLDKGECSNAPNKINIYAPPWGLSTLAKELSAAARIMQALRKN